MKYYPSLFLINIYDQIRFSILNTFRKILFRPKIEGNLLIVRKGTVGDHAVCQPFYLAFRAKYPDKKLFLLTTHLDWEAGKIANLPEALIFDNCFSFKDYSVKSLKKELIKNNINSVCEIPQDVDTLYTQIRNMLFYRYCGIRNGCGWQIGNSYLLKFFRYFNKSHPREFLKHQQTINKQVNFFIPENYLPLNVKKENQFALSVLLPKKYIVIAPGAKLLSKKWDKFALLIKSCLLKGYHIVIVGLEIDSVGQIAHPNMVDLCGKTTLEELRFVLSKAQLLICNDSGPMHIAYSLNTPLIALFGSRNYPGNWWPPENERNIIRHKADKKWPLAFVNNTLLSAKLCPALCSIELSEVENSLEKLLAAHLP